MIWSFLAGCVCTVVVSTVAAVGMMRLARRSRTEAGGRDTLGGAHPIGPDNDTVWDPSTRNLDMARRARARLDELGVDGNGQPRI